MGLGIKKQDTVLVTSGKEKGKKGRVLSVLPDKERVIVEKVNMIKKHMRPSKKYSQGGIIDREGPIHVSSTMLICPRCNKPTRTANVLLDGKKKVRSCKKCKEVIDQ